MFSDNLETITGLPIDAAASQTTYTLWKCTVDVSSEKTFRVVPYHLNATGSNLVIGVAARLSRNSTTLSDRVYEDFASGNFSGDASCIAAAQLYQSFPHSGSNITLGTTEQVIWSKSGSNNHLIQGLIQFKVAAVSANLHLRVYASASASIPGSWDDPVCLPVGTHGRGTWDHSTLDLDGGSFDANQSLSTPLRVGICITDGPEQTEFDDDAQTGGLRDKGAWGANLFYTFELTNSGSQTGSVYCYMEARNDALDSQTGNAAPWRGAAYVKEPSGYPHGRILSRPYGTGIGIVYSDPRLAPLTVDEYGIEAPIFVNPNQTKQLVIGVANGGTSTLPVNILLSRLSMAAP